MSESGFGAVVDRVLDGTAAPPLRSAAARGALPLPREVLVRLQVHLLEDPEVSVRETAAASLHAIDADSLRGVLSEPDCPPEVLVHFAARAARDETLAERIAFHAAAPAQALAVLAGSGSAAVIELVLTNQEMLRARPGLLERLMGNPALRPDQRGRILELLERIGDRAERMRDDDAPDPDDAEEIARLLEVDPGELLSASEILGGEEFETTDDLALRTVYRKILTLNTAQKAILAMKGGREERMILIRDSNRTVALGVLRNGRLTETEVEGIARMRNVTDEVLRHVGTHREWTKNYAVIHSLVNNPRTPQGLSSNFVSRLTNRDLKSLAGSREVPELIRRMAKRTHDLRTQPQRSGFKKK